MAAALGCMVASMSRGKKNYLQYERELSDAIARLTELREQLKSAVDADAESYAAVVKAYKTAKESSNGEAGVLEALKGATNVPLSVAERSREVAAVLESLKGITNPKMASDLKVGLALARAATDGALANVDINLESLSDAGFVSDVRKRTAKLQV
jgi:formiminotetrahydrofolate cyclodeaminase